METEEYYIERSGLKQYVEEHQIIRLIDLEIKNARMESELQFHSRIDTITTEEMDKLIDKEIKTVERLIHEKVAWQQGYCILDDKDIFLSK